MRCNGCFFKFGVEVGVEVSIVNALYRLRITDQLFQSYAFTRVVRSQSTLQRLLRRQILKNTLYVEYLLQNYFNVKKHKDNTDNNFYRNKSTIDGII
jgi:hypothetical protein